MDNLSYLLNLVFGGLAVPVIEKIKQKYEAKGSAFNPMMAVLSSFVLVLAATTAYSYYTGLNMTPDQIIDFATKSQVMSQIMHAAVKSGAEETLTKEVK